MNETKLIETSRQVHNEGKLVIFVAFGGYFYREEKKKCSKPKMPVYKIFKTIAT